MLPQVLEKTLESPLDSKEIKSVNPNGNQLWIFIGRTDAGAEAPIFGHLMQRTNTLKKTVMLGKIEAGRKGNDRGWYGWMASLTHSMDMNLSNFWEIVEDRGTWHARGHEVAESQTWLRGWTTTKLCWVFLAMHWPLGAARGLFSSCREGSLLSSCSGWASHCGGFSFCEELALECVGSVIVLHRFSFPAWGILVPRPGIEPMSPELAGGFLTTGPPGMSAFSTFRKK